MIGEQLLQNIRDKKWIILATLFFILNVFLRFYKLGDASIWCDEAHSIYTSLSSMAEIFDIAKSDQNPPVYNILLSFWVDLWGISAFAVRSFSALLTSITVILII